MKYLKTYEQKNLDINNYLSEDGKTLDLSDLGLTELPELPKELEYLICENNKLTKLPELPKELKYLYCWQNNIHDLSRLPKSMLILNCGNNNLSELPELPETLTHLYCSGNNNLPYNDLEGYWKWFSKEYPDLWAAKQMGLY